MAVTKLPPGGRARCTPGQATLGWSVDGAALPEVVLRVVQQERRDVPAVAVQMTGQGRLLVAALPLAVAVVVEPRGGGAFPNGVSVSPELTVRVDGVDGDQYVLPDVDVSGTTSQVLLTITPSGTSWELGVPEDVAVRDPRVPAAPAPAARPAPVSDQGPGRARTPVEPEAALVPEGEPDQGDVVQRAAWAAVRQVGVARLPADARSELQVAVDRSASLLPALRSGAVQTLLEVLTGVNTVCGSAEQLPVWELGRVPARLPRPLDRSSVPGFTTHVLGERVTTEGTPLAGLVRSTAASGSPRTVVVLTDGVPADLDEVTLALRDSLRARGTTRWHVLALARGLDDPAVQHEPWRDELGALRPLVAERLLTVSSVTPGSGAGWLAERLTDAAALESLVAALPLRPTP